MSMLLLPLLLLGSGDGWVSTLRATIKEEGGRGKIIISAKTSLPNGAIVNVRVRTFREIFIQEEKKITHSAGSTSIGRRVEVKRGRIEIKLPLGRPGTHEVVITIDPKQQTKAVRRALRRRSSFEKYREDVMIANPSEQLKMVRQDSVIVERWISETLSLIRQKPGGGATLVRKIKAMRNKLRAENIKSNRSISLARASFTRADDATRKYAMHMRKMPTLPKGFRQSYPSKDIDLDKSVAEMKEEMELSRVILGQELVIWHLRFVRVLYQELQVKVTEVAETVDAERPDLLAKRGKEMDAIADSFEDVIRSNRVKIKTRDALRDLIRGYRALARALVDEEIAIERIEEDLQKAIELLRTLEEDSRKVDFKFTVNVEEDPNKPVKPNPGGGNNNPGGGNNSGGGGN